MSDTDDNSSQSSINESITHDRHSQLILDEDDQFSSEEEENEINVDALADEVDWTSLFKDDAEEFEPETHQENSELGFSANSTPLEILETLLTGDMLEKICEQSELYANQKHMRNFRPFDVGELWRFLAVNLSMGIVKLSAIKDYWRQKSFFKISFFAETMARDRFIQILRAIHFTNNEEISPVNTDRFIKLGTFMDDLLKNFKTLVHPGEYLCLDESMVPYKGRLSIKQYNPKKRTRFGVKLFILVDCATKIILDVIPYQGANTKMKYSNLVKDLGFGGATVVSMLEPYFQKRHRVVVDNWFNSPKLASILKSKKTYVLGTVQKNRKSMPKTRNATRKMKRGEVEIFSDGDILVERWCDRRDVFMLNSFLSHVMVESESSNPRNTRQKPGSVLLYNSKMGAVDESDKVIKPYKSCRKTYKWYRKVAFHLIDLAVYNSYLTYKEVQKKKLSYKDYLEDLIPCILSKYPKPVVTIGRPRTFVQDEDRLKGSHFPLQGLNKDRKPSRSRCFYCFTVCNERKMTWFVCGACGKRLCIGTDSESSCFSLYHTQRKLKKKAPEQPFRNNPDEIELDLGDESESQNVSSASISLLDSRFNELNGLQTGEECD